MLTLLASRWRCEDPRVLLAWQQRRPDITATLSHLKIKSLSINYSPTRKILLPAGVFFFFPNSFLLWVRNAAEELLTTRFLKRLRGLAKNARRAEKLQTFPQSESDTVERIRARIPTNRGGVLFYFIFLVLCENLTLSFYFQGQSQVVLIEEQALVSGQTHTLSKTPN